MSPSVKSCFCSCVFMYVNSSLTVDIFSPMTLVAETSSPLFYAAGRHTCPTTMIWTKCLHRETGVLQIWPCLLVDYHLYPTTSVSVNDMPALGHRASLEEEELNKTHNVKASSWMSNRCVSNASVHVRSVVRYEYLRHSMTSHSGCWWFFFFESFHLAGWAESVLDDKSVEGTSSWSPGWFLTVVVLIV